MSNINKFDIYRLRGCSEMILEVIKALDSVEYSAKAKLSLAKYFIDQALKVIEAQERLNENCTYFRQCKDEDNDGMIISYCNHPDHPRPSSRCCELELCPFHVFDLCN